jgi:hypothetical protein
MRSILFLVCFLPSIARSNEGNQNKNQQDAAVSGRIFFSTSPFGSSSANNKTNFTSHDFIYARFELSGSTIREAFKLKESTGNDYLVCNVEVLKDGEPVGFHTYDNNYILLQKSSLDNNWLNFDILPDPAKASTLYSMTNDFTAGYGYMPLYYMITPDYFPEGGTYHLNIRILSKTRDAYDREQDQDKWPFLEEGFDFTLNEGDIAMLKKNGTITRERMEKNAFQYDKMPPVFANPGKLTDPNATTAKVSAILKRDLPDRAIIKFVAEQYNGSNWSIAKDDFGLPRYKYFNPHIWMVYKSGGQCFIGYVTLRQVYSGGGTYGPLEVAWTSTKDDRVIDCAKVK